MHEQRLRLVAAGVGISMALFGAASLVAPRRFTRFFGISAPDPSTVSMLYSIGTRDVALGMGLWLAAMQGGAFAPWRLARLLADSGDAAGVGGAVAPGWRKPPFPPLRRLAPGPGRRCFAGSGGDPALGRHPSPRALSHPVRGRWTATGVRSRSSPDHPPPRIRPLSLPTPADLFLRMVYAVPRLPRRSALDPAS